MSTAAVAKSLGVSRRTLMRWVNQLDMQLEKNELGHYQFSEADIERLRQVQNQTNQETQTQHTQSSQNSRTGTVKNGALHNDDSKVETLNERMNELEQKMRSKADDVVSYQLLQHRKEMDDLMKKISTLEKKVEALENALTNPDADKENGLAFEQPSSSQKKSRRKSLISSIFSF